MIIIIRKLFELCKSFIKIKKKFLEVINIYLIINYIIECNFISNEIAFFIFYYFFFCENKINTTLIIQLSILIIFDFFDCNCSAHFAFVFNLIIKKHQYDNCRNLK